ncbi:MAG TPA: BON domain-containing protein [Desulfobacteraceae bacterium]|nr:BON domain-containing protein [Desulfobacteraceae bacterium]
MEPGLKIIPLILAFALVLSVCSCQTPAGRSAGEVVDDATITTKVKSKLFEDRVLSGFSIAVKTFQGEVTLTGSVLSPGEKQRATTVARSVTGVKKVNNLLTIKDS